MLGLALRRKAEEQARAQAQASGGSDPVAAAPAQAARSRIEEVPESQRLAQPAALPAASVAVISTGQSTPPIPIPSPKAPAKSPVGDSPVTLFGNRPAGVRFVEWVPPQFSSTE